MIAAAESSSPLVTIVFPIIGLLVAIGIWAKTQRVGPAVAVFFTTVLLMTLADPKMTSAAADRFETGMNELQDGFDEDLAGTSDDESKSQKADESDPTPSEKKSPEPESSSSDSAGDESSPPPWEWIGFGVAALLAVCLAGFLLVVGNRAARRAAKKRKEAQEQAARKRKLREQHRADWSDLLVKEKSLGAEWLQYEDSLELSLRYPVMRDVSEPKVAAVIEAMGHAKAYRSPEPPDVDVNPVETKFAEAVAEFEAALRAAETHAKRVRWNNYAPGERKKAEQALKMLKLAMDTANYPAERKRAYERVARLMEDLAIPVSPRAMDAIESSVGRLELTAA